MTRREARDEQARAALEALPNIGETLARALIAAGICSPDALRAVGSVEATLRLALHRPPGSACRSALCALEGAIRGVRWHAIPKEERDALWERYSVRRP